VDVGYLNTTFLNSTAPEIEWFSPPD
jgi:hypothetical protein